MRAWQFPPVENPTCTALVVHYLSSIVCMGRMMPMRMILEPLLVGRSDSERSHTAEGG